MGSGRRHQNQHKAHHQRPLLARRRRRGNHHPSSDCATSSLRRSARTRSVSIAYSATSPALRPGGGWIFFARRHPNRRGAAGSTSAQHQRIGLEQVPTPAVGWSFTRFAAGGGGVAVKAPAKGCGPRGHPAGLAGEVSGSARKKPRIGPRKRGLVVDWSAKRRHHWHLRRTLPNSRCHQTWMVRVSPAGTRQRSARHHPGSAGASNSRPDRELCHRGEAIVGFGATARKAPL